MHSKDVIKKLKKDGWEKVGQTGSHVQFRHPEKSGRVTVPHPKKDIPKGTLKSIERQSGLVIVSKKQARQKRKIKNSVSMRI